MRKFKIFFIVFILASASLYAQVRKEVEFFAMGGLNFYNLKFSYQEALSLPRHEAELAHSLGGGVRFYLFDKFSLEADVLYKTKKSELVEFSGLNWGDTFYTLRYFSFPVLVHYSFPSLGFNFFANFGLEINILRNSQLEDKKNEITKNPIPYTSPADFQLVGGCGIRYKPFSFELRYGFGLSNLNTETKNRLVIKNRGFELFIAYHF
ncbi:MAG: outer membrane beta-barrel protein [Candidatus Aminicenantaceae bacterium]